MVDDFKDYPKSIGEVRSEGTRNSEDWTPRECLISVLRAIDDGEKIDALVVCYRHYVGGKAHARFLQSTKDGLVTLGLMSTAAVHMVEDD